MNKVRSFPALRAPTPLSAIALHPVIFISNFSNTDELDLSASLGKTSLAKRT